ncbi:MAG: response regulator [Planctomycetes bacterium]|nr:response regulator [Planctomycetota bacterium]
MKSFCPLSLEQIIHNAKIEILMNLPEAINILVLDVHKEETDYLKRISDSNSLNLNITRCNSIREMQVLPDDPDFMPDMIILKQCTLGGEAPEMIAIIKTIPLLQNLPIIVITANRDDASLKALYQHGAHSYLLKPNSYRELMSLLHDVTDYWFHTTLTPSSQSQCSRSILLVEDEDSQVFLVREAMEDLGYTGDLVFVKDGLEALDYLNGTGDYAGHSKRPDLIVLDLKMPRMSGIEFLDEVKSIECASSVPVAVMSFSTATSDIQNIYSRGSVSCIPIDCFLELKAQRLEAIINYWQHLVVRAPKELT